MKRVVLFLALFCASFSVVAQDVIVKRDKSEIQALILRVDEKNVEYKKWNNQGGPTYSISIGNISSIRYANGDVERFVNVQPSTPTNNQQNDYTSNNQIKPKQQENNFHETTVAVLQSQIANQKAKLGTANTVGAIITTLTGIGAGVGVGVLSGSWLGGGLVTGGIIVGGILITSAVTSSYRTAISDLELQLKSVKSKNGLSFCPVIVIDELGGNYGAGMSLSFSF